VVWSPTSWSPLPITSGSPRTTGSPRIFATPLILSRRESWKTCAAIHNPIWPCPC
jgi:hypothetical protein